MTDETATQSRKAKPSGARRLMLAIGASLAVALICFVVLATLPEAPRAKAPLRSFLTGLAVLGVAIPLCIGGSTLKQRFASSPYFEGTFIATVLSVFGFAGLAAGLACLILGAYDLLAPLLSQ
jgi:hypothetical protein